MSGPHHPPDSLLRSCQELAETYEDLAEQMRLHHNAAAAALFTRLNQEVLALLQALGAENARNLAPAPESTIEEDLLAGVHYLMQPYHVLALALRVEQRLVSEPENSEDDGTRAAWRPLMENRLGDLARRLAQCPRPEPGWNQDPDPPHIDQ